MQLRPYQKQAIDAVIRGRKSGTRRMVVCLPTGAGKTVIFSELARMARRDVLVLAHREELLAQAADKLQRAVGAAKTVDIEQGERRASREAHIVVASIRSLHSERLARLKQGRDFGLILYDECHHAVADDNKRVLGELGCFDKGWTGTLLGLTATTNRADGIGLDEVFERIVFKRGVAEMMDEGWLVPLKGFRVATSADLRNVGGGGLDFLEDELAEAVDIEERNALVARSIQELARDRRTVAFCVTVNHARNLCRALNHLGVPAGIVYGAMKKDARQQALADFRNGKTTVLTNVGVLTEGFDDPGVSCIAMARPTRSEALYMQCVGRGTRLHPGKTDCLVLDFVDLSNLSLVSLPSLLGMPWQLDLQGMDANEARKTWSQVMLEAPGFELLPGVITLGEIQDRAAAFDPLTREVSPEVRAISSLAWESLGRRGLALHLLRRPTKVTEVLILDDGGRGKRWQVQVDGKERGRFSRLTEAVEATEYEVSRMGERVHQSGLPSAQWRRVPVDEGLGELARKARRGRPVDTIAEALAALTYAEVIG